MIESTQVQGGGVAVVIGAHVWNRQLLDIRLSAVAGDTVVSGLLGSFDNCSISKSRALSNTSAFAFLLLRAAAHLYLPPFSFSDIDFRRD